MPSLPLPRLSSRGDFLVRLRLSNLRPGWQRFKSTRADLELGRKKLSYPNQKETWPFPHWSEPKPRRRPGFFFLAIKCLPPGIFPQNLILKFYQDNNENELHIIPS